MNVIHRAANPETDLRRSSPIVLRSVSCVAIAALLAGAGCRGTSAREWPQFRGVNCAGVGRGAAPPVEIGPETNVVWKTPLPPGHSSPVVWGDRVYVTGVRDESLLTIALDAASGQILWERALEPRGEERIHSIGSHAQPSPATDGERVVSLFGAAGLVCYSADGDLEWTIPMGPFNDDFGAGSSPVIDGDRVIVAQDHDTDSFLRAIDKRTGDEIWHTDRAEFTRSYATPIVREWNGRREIVLAGTLRVVGYDYDSGDERWTARGLSRIVNVTPTVGRDGVVYVTGWAPGADAGDRISVPSFTDLVAEKDEDKSETLEADEIDPGGAIGRRFRQIDRDKDGRITRTEYEGMRHVFETAQNVIMAISPGGDGDVTSTHIRWTHDRMLPYVPSPVLVAGRIFMVKNSGIVSCLDAASGEVLKHGRVSGGGNYYSSPVVGGGHVYLLSERGELSVITAEADWQEVGSVAFNEDAYATPAIVGGRIYLRTSEHLYCFGEE